MATSGIRTYTRISTDDSLPVDQRILETTNQSNLVKSVAEADFVTIPREMTEYEDGLSQGGYSWDYAQRIAQVLKEKFGFIGRLRLSQSGKSFVIERQVLGSGASLELGLEPAVQIINGTAA